MVHYWCWFFSILFHIPFHAFMHHKQQEGRFVLRPFRLLFVKLGYCLPEIERTFVKHPAQRQVRGSACSAVCAGNSAGSIGTRLHHWSPCDINLNADFYCVGIGLLGSATASSVCLPRLSFLEPWCVSQRLVLSRSSNAFWLHTGAGIEITAGSCQTVVIFSSEIKVTIYCCFESI